MTTATNHPTPELLSESALAEIEAREVVASTVISDLNHGRVRWRLGVPARPDTDPDLVISASLRDIPALCATLRAAWEENEQLKNVTIPDSISNLVRRIDASIRFSVPIQQQTKLRSFINELIFLNAALRDQLAELQRRNDTQAESIMEFQAGEKSLRAQLAQVEQERESILRSDFILRDRLTQAQETLKSLKNCQNKPVCGHCNALLRAAVKEQP